MRSKTPTDAPTGRFYWETRLYFTRPNEISYIIDTSSWNFFRCLLKKKPRKHWVLPNRTIPTLSKRNNVHHWHFLESLRCYQRKTKKILGAPKSLVVCYTNITGACVLHKPLWRSQCYWETRLAHYCTHFCTFVLILVLILARFLDKVITHISRLTRKCTLTLNAIVIFLARLRARHTVAPSSPPSISFMPTAPPGSAELAHTLKHNAQQKEGRTNDSEFLPGNLLSNANHSQRFFWELLAHSQCALPEK